MERSKPVQKVFTCGDDLEQNNLQVFLLILILKIYAHRQVTRHFVATTSCDSGIIIDRHTGVRVARYRTYHLHSQHYNHSNQWSSSWLRTPLTLQFSSRLPHSSCTCCVVNPHNSEQVSLISKNCWLWNYIMYVWGFLYLRFKQLVDLALYTAKILYLGNVRISKICQKF